MAFKTKVMNLRSTARHVLNEVRKLKDQMRARQLHNVSIPRVSDVTNDFGTVVQGEFIAPSSTATSTTPTSTGFTGAAMGGNGWTFGSVVYQFVAVAAGVLQAGFNAAGKFIAGAGAVTLDADGVTILSGSAIQNKIKIGGTSMYDVTDIFGVHNVLPAAAQSQINFDAQSSSSIVQVNLDAAAAATSSASIYVNGLTISVHSANGTVINSTNGDYDTLIKGDTTTVVTVDAGLEAVGIGGAAESGKILKATGDISITGASTLSGPVTTGSTINSNRVIRFHSTKTGIADNSATGLFAITTTNETGSADGGTYSVKVRANIQHGAASTHTAVKYFECYWVRAMRETGVGTNSAITELVESASTATNAAEKDISTVTATVTETSEYVNQFNIQIDLTGTGVTTAVVNYDVELIWNFTTAPTIATV